MSYEEILGLLIGLGVLWAVLGYLSDVYFHPQRFRWLELPRGGKLENAVFAKVPSSPRNAA